MILCRSELFEKLEAGCVVLTPNLRLTKVLTESYDLMQTAEVWPAPYIYPFNHYLEKMWQFYCSYNEEEHLTLLNELQSNLIWLQLIKNDTPDLYNYEALAKKIKQAWGHCLAFGVDTSEEMFTKNEETHFFQKILGLYQSSTPGKISQAELESQLTHLLESGIVIPMPKTIILAYFDDFTPSQQRLLTLIQENKLSQLLYFDEQKKPHSIHRVEALTEQEELSSMIQWVKNHFRDPSKKIGVVLPKLQESRDVLEHLLLKHFNQEDFNISMGKSLDQFSIVSNGLSLLSFPNRVVSLEQIHLLCHSSFMGKATTEVLVRSRLYHTLKSSTEKNFYVKTLLEAAKNSYLGERLTAVLKLLNEPKKQSLPEWSDSFIKALEVIGFPGEQILSSHEYQVHMRFMQALVEYAQLGDSTQLYSKNEATHLLDWQLKQIIFQPKAHESRIHFIGYLESLGLQFDALWVMDLNEFQLPQKLNPSAFIPIEIQREKQMPHASEARELLLSTKQINRLSRSANEIIFSHHLNTEQGECLPSFLIDAYPLLSFSETYSLCAEPDQPLEIFDGCVNTPLITFNDVKGGSYLIKEQAQCPFRAFSKFRLRLPEERENIEGLDSLDKGILIHEVMELFWLEVVTQAQLLLLEKRNELSSLLFKVIDKALLCLKHKKPYTFNALFLELERNRLYKIAMKYLALEKARPPFKVIHIEYESFFIVNELTIKLRVDRIDELENGDWLVIDYKTGVPSLSSMFETRILEPQLPIYVLTEDKVKAVLYAQLQQRSIKNKGISKNEVNIQGVNLIEKQQKITWEAQRDQWQVALELLTSEFISGEIKPAPKSETLCIGCAYTGLCSVYSEL